MWLRSLEADGLRNLGDVRLELDEALTLVCGRNGQGKTSLLEAVYLLGTGRSFRTRNQEELVGWGEALARVAGGVERRAGRTEIAVAFERGTRRLLVGGAERELEDFLGRLDVIDLTAERMNVLRGGPEERRRFLDRGIVGLRPSFLVALGRYRRTLQQRNAFLRRSGGAAAGSIAAELGVWDERLAAAAVDLHAERSAYLAALAGRLGPAAATLFGEPTALGLRYRSSPADVENQEPGTATREAFERALHRSRERDLNLAHTTTGPHRDEVLVELDGIDLRKFGSAGQVRAAMVTLKLAKLALLRDDRGEAPVFLMDDFDTDLDERRTSALAVHLRRERFQVLVATSKEAMADRLGIEFDRVVMRDGQATRGGA